MRLVSDRVACDLLLRRERDRYHVQNRVPLDIECQCFRDKSKGQDRSSSPDDWYDLGIGVDLD